MNFWNGNENDSNSARTRQELDKTQDKGCTVEQKAIFGCLQVDFD